MRKVVSIILISINVILFCVGCSGCKAEQTIGKSHIKKTDDKRVNLNLDKTIKISAFEGEYGSQYWEEVVAAFNNRYPNVKVIVEISPQIGLRLKSQIACCDFPDLIYHIQSKEDEVLIDLIKNDLLLCLDDVFESKALDSDKKIKDIIRNEVLQSSLYKPYNDNKIYFAPFNASPCGLVYNKTLFKKKGYNQPSTWDEFFKLGDKVKKDNIKLFVYDKTSPSSFNQLLLPAIASSEGSEGLQKLFNYNEDIFNDDNIIKIVNNIETLAKEYTVEDNYKMNQIQAKEQFMSGHALFMPSGVWLNNELKNLEKTGEDIEFALLPCLKINENNQSYILIHHEQLCIPKGAKNPQVAKEFIKFMYTKESIKLFAKYASGIMATNNAVGIIKEDVYENFYDMATQLNNPQNKLFCQNFNISQVDSNFCFNKDILDDGLLRLFNQEITASKFLKQSQNDFLQIRIDYLKKDG